MTRLYFRSTNSDLDATDVPTAIDTAWAAGVYEGEGTCRNCGRGKRSLALAVVQKDPEILFRLKKWFGGSIQDSGNRSGCFTWNLCGDRARMFLVVIYSLLSNRRKAQVNATGALNFLEGKDPESLEPGEAKSLLEAQYEKQRQTTWKNPEVRQSRRATLYQLKKEAGNRL